MTTSSDIATTLLGSVATPVSLKSWTQLASQSSGAFRRTICRWTTTRCRVLWDITIEWTSYEKFKARDTVTSKINQNSQLKSKFIEFTFNRFLRNPSELKSIKNISLLRQSMANSNQQQSTAPTHQQTTNSAAALQASALASLLPQSTNLHQLTAALVQNSKMEFNKNKIEDEPTDLSTSNGPSSDRKFIKNEADCYP